MISKHSPTDISRSEGCTLTGVLSVTGFLEDAVTVIHGPSGCAHHNASLLHASLAEIDAADLPVLISSSLSEEEVIFGGEGALAHALDIAASLDPDLICVISTCIADTIGDDCAALCRQKREMPVVYIPGAGFLGGGFSEGIRNALMSLLPLSSGADQTDDAGVMIVGEKTWNMRQKRTFTKSSDCSLFLISTLVSGLSEGCRLLTAHILDLLRSLYFGNQHFIRSDLPSRIGLGPP